MTVYGNNLSFIIHLTYLPIHLSKHSFLPPYLTISGPLQRWEQKNMTTHGNDYPLFIFKVLGPVNWVLVIAYIWSSLNIFIDWTQVLKLVLECVIIVITMSQLTLVCILPVPEGIRTGYK